MNSTNESPRVIRLDEARSTNSSLRAWLEKEKLPEGSVVLTDNQTAGRGQVGNSWESEPGMNLTFSIVLYPTCISAKEQFLISQIAALSVKETLDAYTTDITVKWPNDIYWKDKKICGMLIENDLSGRTIYSSIIGIGLNINQEEFRSDAPNPVSLTQITGETYDKESILRRFLSRFYAYYLRLLQEEQSEIRSAYQAVLYRGDGFYPYQDAEGAFEARIHHIEPTGHLVLELPDGSLRRYAFKEVSVLLPTGSGADKV